MLKVLAGTAAAFITLGLTAYGSMAADLGKPATLDQILALPDRKASTCYVEASAAGTYMQSSREAQAGIGGGCDAILANLVIGGGIRADFADWRNAGSVFAKIGLVINSGAHIYGLAEWKVPEWKPSAAGQLMLGVGSEIKVEIINPNLWLFGEFSAAASKFGPAVAKDDVGVRIGARYRF
jgi:hypothetical protein